MLFERVKDVEICYVLAVADLEIFYGFGINGFKVTGVGHFIFLRVLFYWHNYTTFCGGFL